MDDEIKMNKLKEIAIDAAIRAMWVQWFDAFSEPNKLDQAILFILYEIKNPNPAFNGTKEWRISDIEKKLQGTTNFAHIHESIYGKLQPKGFIIVETTRKLGNCKFIKLTEIGEKFVYEAQNLSKEYVDMTKKKFETPQQQKEKITLL